MPPNGSEQGEVDFDHSSFVPSSGSVMMHRLPFYCRPVQEEFLYESISGSGCDAFRHGSYGGPEMPLPKSEENFLVLRAEVRKLSEAQMARNSFVTVLSGIDYAFKA